MWSFPKYKMASLMKENNFVALVMCVYLATLTTGVIANFKLLFVFSMLMVMLLFYRLKDFFISFFLISLTALLIFAPNKYYTVEVIRGFEIFLPKFRDGYYLGYGVTISNILLIFSTAFLLLKCYKSRFFLLNCIKGSKFLLLAIVMSWFIFFLAGLYSSIFISFSSELSVAWFMQYMQLCVIALSVACIHLLYKNKIKLIFTAIMVSLFFEIFLGVTQFVFQSHLNLVIEQSRGGAFYTGLDENNALFRIDGTFMYSNQLGLIALVFFCILLPTILNKRKKIYLGAGFGNIVLILFTQSRVVWLASGIVFLFAVFRYKNELIKTWKKFLRGLNTQKIISMLLFFSTCMFIIIPRSLNSINYFYEGAGGSIRYKMLKEGMEAFIVNPWFGYGAGTNEYVLHKLFPAGVMSVFPAAIHLGYLQLALEVGVIGFVAFIIPFSLLAKKIIPSKNNTHLDEKMKADYMFIYITGILSFGIYYIFQPHVGIVEFPYLGLITGFGLVYNLVARDSVNIYEKNYKKN